LTSSNSSTEEKDIETVAHRGRKFQISFPLPHLLNANSMLHDSRQCSSTKRESNMVAKLQNVPELSESNNQHPRTSSPPPLPLPVAAASKLQ
jgi:hypothetical protein